MALKMDIELDNKLQAKDAYIRVEDFSGTKERIFFSVNAYNVVGEEKYLIKSMKPKGFEGYILSFVLEPKDNIIKQCYEHLKTLPAFVDSIDC